MLLIPLFMIVFKIPLLESIVATVFISTAFLPIDLIVYWKYCAQKSVGRINDLLYTGVRYTENSPVYYKDALPKLFGHRNNFYMIPAKMAYQGSVYPYYIDTLWLYSSIENMIYYLGPASLQSEEIPEKYDALVVAAKFNPNNQYRSIKIIDPHALEMRGFEFTFNTTQYYLYKGSLLTYRKYVSDLWNGLGIENRNMEIHNNTKKLMERQYGKRTIDLALLTPAIYWFAKVMDVDVGAARSMVLHCIREGREVSYSIKECLGDLTPDWKYLKSLLENEPREVWCKRSAEWQRAISESWPTLTKLFQDRKYDQMITTVDRSLKEISKRRINASTEMTGLKFRECDKMIDRERDQSSSTNSAFLELVDTVQSKIDKAKSKSKSASEYDRIYRQYLDVCYKLDHTSTMKSIDIYRLEQTKRALENMLRQMVALGKDK